MCIHPSSVTSLEQARATRTQIIDRITVPEMTRARVASVKVPMFVGVIGLRVL